MMGIFVYVFILRYKHISYQIVIVFFEILTRDLWFCKDAVPQSERLRPDKCSQEQEGQWKTSSGIETHEKGGEPRKKRLEKIAVVNASLSSDESRPQSLPFSRPTSCFFVPTVVRTVQNK